MSIPQNTQKIMYMEGNLGNYQLQALISKLLCRQKQSRLGMTEKEKAYCLLKNRRGLTAITNVWMKTNYRI